jgi:predicted HD phosphohydrolase
MAVDTGPGSVGAAWAQQTELRRGAAEEQAEFRARAAPIVERHRAQDPDQIAALRCTYAKPVFGKVRVWDMVERLGSCVDPTDERLFCASQQIHVLQILEAMEHDGTATPDMVLVALIHDLGKVLLTTGEDPANVVCMTDAVDGGSGAAGAGAPEAVTSAGAGAGLDHTMLQWNHDEFAYERLRDHVSEDMAWLIRYHSIDVGAVSHLMDARDLERTERLLLPFAHYDHATKSPFNLPSISLASYRDVIEEAFPRKIRF